jgi:hypothetical protein
MSRAEQELWREGVMVWLERFVLVILALIFWNWVMNNGLQIDGQFRVSLALVIIGLSYGVGHAVYRQTRNPSPANASGVSGHPTSTDRIFVPENVDLDYLTSTYRDNTAIQADALFAVYRGKWMRVSGSVFQIVDVPSTNNLPPKLSVSVRSPRNGSAHRDGGHFLVFLTFDNSWREQLSTFRIGSNLSVIGQLESLGSTGPILEHCEISR